MAIVVFNPATFIVAFPMFATVDAGLLTGNFAMAGLYLNNTDASPVRDVGIRGQLLNLLTAHITALTNGVNGVAPSGLVGRVSSASEGSVSVSADMGATSSNAAWYMQTQWGASYWQATARFRTFRMAPGRSLPQVMRPPYYWGGR